ncbi:hypothetical protein FRC04_000855 [Tulasnella sp. 424]|nr:hypothetical protein FRC04_000855 [Tulasnella sp. 424]KAG8975412.1 hypothetical protein FRC05_005742 [Tulasnella sp. 425]
MYIPVLNSTRQLPLIDERSIQPPLSAAYTTPNNPEPFPDMKGSHDERNGPLNKLPTELLLVILQLSLPPLDLQTLQLESCCRSYMRALLELRLVSTLWKEVVDTAPWLWAVLSSTLPLDQNITNIHRSGDWPMIIHYVGTHPLLEVPEQIASDLKFLFHIGEIHHRWQLVWFGEIGVEGVFQSLNEPASQLQTLYIHNLSVDVLQEEELLKIPEQLPSIKHLDLKGVRLSEFMSPFLGLISLELDEIRGDGIAAHWLLETVDGSPNLERLSLKSVPLRLPAPSPSDPTITHNKLRSLQIDLKGEAADFLLRHIHAPHCIHFKLVIATSRRDYDSSLILDTALQRFEPTLQEICHVAKGSSIDIEEQGVAWSVGKSANWEHTEEPFIRLAVEGPSFLSILRWIKRVVEPSSRRTVGVLHLDRGVPLGNAEAVSLLGGLRSVTTIRAIRRGADIPRMLQLLSGYNYEPFLPLLSDLYLRGWGWAPQELFTMVRARFSPLATTCSQLKIEVHDWKGTSGDSINVMEFDVDTLREIRVVKGVTVEFP